MHETREVSRYLQQLLERGERELFFESGDVGRLVFNESVASFAASSPVVREKPQLGYDAATSGDSGSTDWRAILRAADSKSEDSGMTPRRASDPSGQTQAPASGGKGTRLSFSAPEARDRKESDKGAAQTGIVVGSAMPDIFASAAGYKSLDEIAAAVADCRACALCKTALNAVPGEGNANARLVCVGEGPGASEDETGRPFIGAAGQLLTSILSAIKLAREDVFICNVVKHRPPGNRTPLPDEITACLPFLHQQLKLVRPSVILALGTVAAQTLLGTKLTLGKLRGAVHQYHGIPLVVTYHPAALLRNPNWKRPTWEDVQLARKILDAQPRT